MRRFEWGREGTKQKEPKKVNEKKMQRRINEIEEEDEEGYGRTSLETVRESPFEGSSGTVSLSGEDNVYVGVGKGDSSMGALCWALDNLIPSSSSTLLFLIHVFPETHFIPYPCLYISLSYHFFTFDL